MRYQNTQAVFVFCFFFFIYYLFDFIDFIENESIIDIHFSQLVFRADTKSYPGIAWTTMAQN